MIQIDTEMPKSCWECKFRTTKYINTFGDSRRIDYCFITNTDVCGHCKTRSQDCPLREVK